MRRGVSYCNPCTNAAAAAEMMRSRHCDVLLVLDDKGRVTGIVTDYELSVVLSTQAGTASALPVARIMRPSAHTAVSEDDFRNDVMRTLAGGRWTRVRMRT